MDVDHARPGPRIGTIPHIWRDDSRCWESFFVEIGNGNVCKVRHCGAFFPGYRERPAMVGKLRSYETMTMTLLERQTQLQQLEGLLAMQ